MKKNLAALVALLSVLSVVGVGCAESVDVDESPVGGSVVSNVEGVGKVVVRVKAIRNDDSGSSIEDIASEAEALWATPVNTVVVKSAALKYEVKTGSLTDFKALAAPGGIMVSVTPSTDAKDIATTDVFKSGVEETSIPADAAFSAASKDWTRSDACAVSAEKCATSVKNEVAPRLINATVEGLKKALSSSVKLVITFDEVANATVAPQELTADVSDISVTCEAVADKFVKTNASGVTEIAPSEGLNCRADVSIVLQKSE